MQHYAAHAHLVHLTDYLLDSLHKMANLRTREVSLFHAEHGDPQEADNMGDIDESLVALDQAAATLAEARTLLRKAEGQVSTIAVCNA